jgi:hypothetical protein
VDDDAAVAKEGVDSRLGREVEIEVGDLEARAGGGRHCAVFAAQVTDLTGFWLGGVAGGGLAALIRVEVAEGGGAVAI